MNILKLGFASIPDKNKSILNQKQRGRINEWKMNVFWLSKLNFLTLILSYRNTDSDESPRVRLFSLPTSIRHTCNYIRCGCKKEGKNKSDRLRCFQNGHDHESKFLVDLKPWH